ncbi:hypothetical protein LX36DRAFT_201169 [Colletotrichum falcatum]|nr:hypothetical protein LX36DRAFT_201169 [Colletotrichum falcatum]
MPMKLAVMLWLREPLPHVCVAKSLYGPLGDGSGRDIEAPKLKGKRHCHRNLDTPLTSGAFPKDEEEETRKKMLGLRQKSQQVLSALTPEDIS